jgi:tyrosine phenol-lyase
MRKDRQPAEPYRIKSVEAIKLRNKHERERLIAEAHFNLFKIDAEDIYIDLLTDSGTSAMSNRQWAALMLGDESYAGATSFRKFENTVRGLFNKRFVIPCHQGRVAENLVFSNLMKKGQYVLNNTHFDTTRGNCLHKGGIPVDLPCPESQSDEALTFKGNMDTSRLEAFIKEHGAAQIAMVIMTVTNNSAGGQPVSMANIRETSEICHRYGLLFYFDCARFAENCYFIKRDEPGFAGKSVREIATEMFSYCDGAMMSAKKDGLANIGGFITLDDEHAYDLLTQHLILIEGFLTYGGLAGRDLEVLAVGLEEVLEFDYLDFRIEQVRYFGEQMKTSGMPIIEPTGGHAVFVDAGRLLPHIPPGCFPGHSLAVEFYVEGGIRTVEIGSLMFGGVDKSTGKETHAPRELVRMCLPRRVYTNSHVDYIADTAERIVARKHDLKGYKIVRASEFLRHFTCDLAVCEAENVGTLRGR